MTNEDLTKNFWRYYLMLEKRFIETTEIAEIHTNNFTTFSNGFAMLLQAIGAELDNVFKIYCQFNPDDWKTITDYASYILNDYPGITSQIVKVKDRDIDLIPFKNWNAMQAAQALPWWQAFDHIKHNRFGNIQEANQGNALNMLAALYLLEMKSYKKFVAVDANNIPTEPDMPAEGSKLFILDNWVNRYIPMGNFFAIIDGAVSNK